MNIEIKNANYMNKDKTIIDVEIEHPIYGWIPYTFISNQPDESFDSEIREWLKSNTPSKYIEPEVTISIPTEISMRQCRLELLSQGILDQVDAVLQGNQEAQIEWEYSTSVERDNMLVTTMQNEFDLTDEQVDEMFLNASRR